jgi:hypothetical protein
MQTPSHAPTDRAEDGVIDPRVCAWCINRYRETCLTLCAPEGKYRCLEPVPLEAWEGPPPLPTFRELLEMRGVDKLALLYLALYYIEYLRTKAI